MFMVLNTHTHTRFERQIDGLLKCILKSLDTVAGFVLTDDSGLFCDAYHTTEFGERDCTVLTIMEKSRFPMWLKMQEEQ